MNRVTVTINSRQYNVVAAESEEYIKSLGEHINEKISHVLLSGNNVMGERPLVLAALNICDEYFKQTEEISRLDGQMKAYSAKLDEQANENAELKNMIKGLQEDVKDAKGGQVTMEETETKVQSKELKDQLMEAELKIKFLEGQLRLMETKQKEMKQEFAAREREMLDLLER